LFGRAVKFASRIIDGVVRVGCYKMLHIISATSLYVGYFSAKSFGRVRHREIDCVNYQPLPWIGMLESRRTKGTIERWNAVDAHIKPNSSVLDIGANVGYFVFKAAEKNCMAWGIDSSLPCFLISNYVRYRSGLHNAHFFMDEVNLENVDALPTFDHILFLSVFHHWSAEYGFEPAKSALGRLIDKSRYSFIFEMGQSEMDPKYNIPSMGNDELLWIQELLIKVGKKPVSHLGEFEVFVDKGKTRSSRHLFCVSDGLDKK